MGGVSSKEPHHPNRLSKPPRNGSSLNHPKLVVKQKTYTDCRGSVDTSRTDTSISDDWTDTQSEKPIEHSPPRSPPNLGSSQITVIDHTASSQKLEDGAWKQTRRLSSPSTSTLPIRRASLVKLSRPVSNRRHSLAQEVPGSRISLHSATSETLSGNLPIELEKRVTLDRLPPHAEHPPLIRQRSLLPPGIATRTTDASHRNAHLLPPHDEEGLYDCPAIALRTSQSPLKGSNYPTQEAHQTLPNSAIRPPSPDGLEYSYLGSLKFGSLRVVNSCASPTPSDPMQRYSTPPPSVLGSKTDHVSFLELNQESLEIHRSDRAFQKPQAEVPQLAPRINGTTSCLSRFDFGLSGPQMTVDQTYQTHASSCDLTGVSAVYERSAIPFTAMRDRRFPKHTEDEAVQLPDDETFRPSKYAAKRSWPDIQPQRA